MQAKYVGDNITLNMFHWAQQQLERFLEMARADKSECRQWGSRATYIMHTYHQLLLLYVRLTLFLLN